MKLDNLQSKNITGGKFTSHLVNYRNAVRKVPGDSGESDEEYIPDVDVGTGTVETPGSSVRMSHSLQIRIQTQAIDLTTGLSV